MKPIPRQLYAICFIVLVPLKCGGGVYCKRTVSGKPYFIMLSLSAVSFLDVDVLEMGKPVCLEKGVCAQEADR